MEAYDLSLSSASNNIGHILIYLLPLHLISSTYPARRVLGRYPDLTGLYGPLFTAIHTGNLRLFDSHVDQFSPIFLRKRVYLAIERARQCCIRALFQRAVEEYTGTRIPIDVFSAALKVGGIEQDREETECIVANMIYRGWIKGYISRERAMVVLSAKEGFPKVSGSVAWMKM
jgi:COP9 signalosome complex subunit 12